jgi:hypothetical protein
LGRLWGCVGMMELARVVTRGMDATRFTQSRSLPSTDKAPQSIDAFASRLPEHDSFITHGEQWLPQ